MHTIEKKTIDMNCTKETKGHVFLVYRHARVHDHLEKIFSTQRDANAWMGSKENPGEYYAERWAIEDAAACRS